MPATRIAGCALEMPGRKEDTLSHQLGFGLGKAFGVHRSRSGNHDEGIGAFYGVDRLHDLAIDSLGSQGLPQLLCCSLTGPLVAT